MALGSLLAFERVVEFAAYKTLIPQLAKKRDLQLQAGLTQEKPLKPCSVFGILQPQCVERA